MKKKLLISLLIILCYSCKKEESFPSLHVDPLIIANKQNHINYYLRYKVCYRNIFKDSIVSIDSFKVNKEGLLTDKVCIKGWRNEYHYKYDSIGRLIEVSHSSDYSSRYQLSYKLDSKNNRVLINDHGFIEYSKDFKKMLQEIHMSDKGDTTLHIRYKYSGDKISAIIKNSTYDESTKTLYFYDGNGKLEKIINEDGEEQIISKKTGLIESVFDPHCEKVYYKYFKR